MSNRDNYLQIRESISSNLALIKRLLEQADVLHKVFDDIASLDDDKKEEIEASLQEIYSSIDGLVDQNDRLFKLFTNYTEIAERHK